MTCKAIFEGVWSVGRPLFGGRQEYSASSKETRLAAFQVYERIAQTHYLTNDLFPATYAALRGANLIFKLEPSPELAKAYANLSTLYSFFRPQRLADRYRRRAQEMAQRLNDRPTLAWVLFVSALYETGLRRRAWSEVQAEVEQALALFNYLGDRRHAGDSLTVLGYILYFQAQFSPGIEVGAELYILGLKSDNPEHQAWGLLLQAMNLLSLGQTEPATAFLDMAQPLLAATRPANLGPIIYEGVLALACWRQGQRQAASQAAERATRLMGPAWPIAFALFSGHVGVVEVYLGLWQEALAGGSPLEARAMQAQAKNACQAFRKFARWQPVGQPRAWLYQGRYAWLAGQARQAQQAWQKSLAQAHRLAMPYEAGLAQYDLGRHLPLADPRRREYLSRASAIFSQIGAAADLAQAQAILAGQ